jgi:hypothetical protein
MRKFKDFFGNEITDPWCLSIFQRLDRLTKMNRGRKNFSEEDKTEFDSILDEQNKHWEILKKEIDKIPPSELAKRIQTYLDDDLDDNILFHFSTRRRLRSSRKESAKIR